MGAAPNRRTGRAATIQRGTQRKVRGRKLETSDTILTPNSNGEKTGSVVEEAVGDRPIVTNLSRYHIEKIRRSEGRDKNPSLHIRR